jgi:hypothetical protein
MQLEGGSEKGDLVLEGRAVSTTRRAAAPAEMVCLLLALGLLRPDSAWTASTVRRTNYGERPQLQGRRRDRGTCTSDSGRQASSSHFQRTPGIGRSACQSGIETFVNGEPKLTP